MAVSGGGPRAMARGAGAAACLSGMPADQASGKARNLQQVCLRRIKFPLFAGISPDVNFLRFPEIGVAPGGRSRL